MYKVYCRVEKKKEWKVGGRKQGEGEGEGRERAREKESQFVL